MSWFFGCEAHGILASQPGIEPAPPLTNGHQGSPKFYFLDDQRES